MNIVEALKLIRNGKFIRWTDKNKVYFGLQTELKPMNKKEIAKIIKGDAQSLDKRPTDLSEIGYDEDPRLCIRSIESTAFEEISYDALLKELQDEWDDHNDEDDDE